MKPKLDRFQNLQPGDVVLVHYRNKYYAQVLEVKQRFYTKEEQDRHRGYYKNCNGDCGQVYCAIEGKRYGDYVTVEKILNIDFTLPTRKHRGGYDEAWMTKVDEAFERERRKQIRESVKMLKKRYSGVV